MTEMPSVPLFFVVIIPEGVATGVAGAITVRIVGFGSGGATTAKELTLAVELDAPHGGFRIYLFHNVVTLFDDDFLVVMDIDALCCWHAAELLAVDGVPAVTLERICNSRVVSSEF